MGPHEITGMVPIVTTATVAGEPGEQPVEGEHVWLMVDIAQGETLPQRYKVTEVIGFLMPMAVVEHHADGSTTGRIEGYVGP